MGVVSASHAQLLAVCAARSKVGLGESPTTLITETCMMVSLVPLASQPASGVASETKS